MLVILIILSVVIATSFALLLIFRNNQKIKGCVKAIYRKIMYNAPIRFVLQSAIKLQIGAATVLVLSQDSLSEVSSIQFTAAAMIITTFSVMPVVFFFVVKANQETLGSQKT